MIEAGIADGSLEVAAPAGDVAANLYHQWLGASVMAKILCLHDPFETALAFTRNVLGIGKR